MAAIDRFLKILTPLGIYRLSDNSRVYRELSVWAEEFDLLQAETEGLLRELFIVTAENYGIAVNEGIYTAPNEAEGLSLRRQRLLNRLNLNGNCFTLKEITSAIRDFGAADFQIIEFHSRYNVVVEIYGDYSDASIEFIKGEIKKIMPAHLITEVYFNGISWADIDGESLSFDTMDGKGYSWNYIDEIKI